MTNNLPLLYIASGAALIYAGVAVEIREVELKNKPENLLAISPILFR